MRAQKKKINSHVLESEANNLKIHITENHSFNLKVWNSRNFTLTFISLTKILWNQLWFVIINEIDFTKFYQVRVNFCFFFTLSTSNFTLSVFIFIQTHSLVFIPKRSVYICTPLLQNSSRTFNGLQNFSSNLYRLTKAFGLVLIL